MQRTLLLLTVLIGSALYASIGRVGAASPDEPVKQPIDFASQAAKEPVSLKLDAQPTPEARRIAAMLLPRPKYLDVSGGTVTLEPGAWSEARSTESGNRRSWAVDPSVALQQVELQIANTKNGDDVFAIGCPTDLPALPSGTNAEEAYVLRIQPTGIMARGASPAGIFYAAQTLRQLLRIFSAEGKLPCLTIVDYPTLRTRGIYIEGGQERFGRIVAKDYLIDQIRRLAEFKMNTLVIECYNLFPYASFPACADEGTLSEEDCREIVAEAKRRHVTIVPSLQTLAQASELVWNCDEGQALS